MSKVGEIIRDYLADNGIGVNFVTGCGVPNCSCMGYEDIIELATNRSRHRRMWVFCNGSRIRVAWGARDFYKAGGWTDLDLADPRCFDTMLSLIPKRTWLWPLYRFYDFLGDVNESMSGI